MATSNRKGPTLRAAVADLWRTVTKDLGGAYRPERHYMRGPGPKWQEKHAPTGTNHGIAGLTEAAA